MSQAKKFGAFSGVYTPSLLTILGVIMYMRLGWVVGNAGLYGTIAIILIAHVISITTGLSVSSIATDKKIKTGGIYYMLSRSLGLPIGGAIGITLFIGTAMSIALYLIGFAESFNATVGLGNTINDFRISGSLSLALITMIAFISTSFALKTQFFILIAIVLSIISILLGTREFAPTEVALLPGADSVSLEVVFAIFFPAVTGFTAGVAMSGDLKDPKKSIPTGTIFAIGTGFIVYLGLAVFLAFTVSPELLISDYNILMKIAMFAPLVVAGIWGATLSSALGGILGAPRILQALSIDKVAPGVFGKGKGVENEPRNALLFTFLLAEAGILIGELDVIARVVSMFYLAAYGFINLAAFLESWASSDYRPSFRIPKWVSLLGFLSTFIVMFRLDMLAMIVSFLVIGGVFFLLTRKELSIGSGDVWQSVWTSIVKTGLFRIEKKQMHKRNWEPNILLFSGGTEARPHLVEFSRALSGRLGMVSSFNLIENPGAGHLFPRQRKIEEDRSEEYGIFSRTQECRNIYEAIESIASIYGFSGVNPNTILMGWARNSKHPDRFASLTRMLAELDYNVLYLDYDKERGYGKRSTIDIWWRGLSNNGELTLSLLKFLLTTNEWRNAKVRILLVNNIRQNVAMLEAGVMRVLDNFRVKAEVEIINNTIEKKPFYEIIKNLSSKTDLVMLGLPDVKQGKEGRFVEKTDELVNIIGTTLLVKASSHFDKLSLTTDEADYSDSNIAYATDSDLKAKSSKITLPRTGIPEIDELAEKFEVQLGAIANEFNEKAISSVQRQINNLAILQKNNCVESLRVPTLNLLNNGNGNSSHKKLSLIANVLADSFEHFGDQNIPLTQSMLEGAYSGLMENLEAFYIGTPAVLNPGQQESSVSETSHNSAFFKNGLSRYLNLKEGISSGRLVRTELDKSLKPVLGPVIWSPVKVLYFLQNQLSNELLKALSELSSSKESDLTDELIVSGLQTAFDNFSKLASGHIQRKAGVNSEIFRNFGEKLIYSMANSTHYSTSISKREQKQVQGELDSLASQYAVYLPQLNEVQRMRFVLEEVILSADHECHNIKEEVTQHIQGVKAHIEKVARDIESFRADGRTAANTGQSAELSNDPQLNRDLVLSGIRQLKIKVNDQLDGSVELLSSESLKELMRSDKITVPNSTGIPLSEYVDFSLNSCLLIPLEKELSILGKNLEKSRQQLRRISNHIFIGEVDDAESTVGYPGADSPEMLAISQIGDLHTRLDLIEMNFDSTLKTAHDQFAGHLDLELISDPDFDYSGLRKNNRELSDSDKWSKLRAWKDHQFNRVSALLDRQSYALLKQRQLERYELDKDIGENWRDFSTSMMISPEIQKDLPLYYSQLFRGSKTFQDDEPFPRTEELQTFKQAYTRWRTGLSRAIIITGDPMMGKSYFALRAINSLKPAKIIRIQAHGAGSIKSIDFIEAIRNACGIKNSLRNILEALPAETVILIDNLELWWERSDKGTKVIHLISNMISEYGNKFLFVLCSNSASYEIMKRQTKLGGSVLKRIELMPLDTDAIQQVIMQRHHAGAMNFSWKGTHEDDLGYRQTRSIFSAFHRAGKGNPGRTMLLWLNHISAVSDNEIAISIPDKSNIAPSMKDPYYRMLCEHMLLHRRMDPAKLSRIFTGEDPELILNKVNEMKSAGLVLEDISGYYYPNPAIVASLMEIIDQPNRVL